MKGTSMDDKALVQYLQYLSKDEVLSRNSQADMAKEQGRGKENVQSLSSSSCL